MKNKPLPDKFWEIYDVVRERAEKDPSWNWCEMEKQFAIEQSGIPDEYEEIIFSANEHQLAMMMYETV